jgi:DNA-binding NarL/FixJ family response regulator
MAIQVFIVDDHPLVREGLKMLLAAAGDMGFSGEAASASGALQALAASRPDVLLLDLDLGEEDGVEWLPRIATAAPSTRILALTGLRERSRHEAALLAGARGLVMKDRPAAEILAAIRGVHAGALCFERPLLEAALQRATREDHRPDDSTSRLASLTEREREIVELVGQGLRNADVAARLGIREKTLRNHLSAIYEKLGVADRVELLVFSYHRRVTR